MAKKGSRTKTQKRRPAHTGVRQANAETARRNLRVSTWKVQAVGLVSVAFFSYCAIGAWTSGQTDVALGFIPFVVVSAVILLISGSIYLTADVLEVRTPLGRFEILWREVTRVEYGSGSIVFFGGEKRLCISAYKFWSGPDRDYLFGAIELELIKRAIPTKHTFRADFLFPKHTRVS